MFSAVVIIQNDSPPSWLNKSWPADGSQITNILRLAVLNLRIYKIHRSQDSFSVNSRIRFHIEQAQRGRKKSIKFKTSFFVRRPSVTCLHLACSCKEAAWEIQLVLKPIRVSIVISHQPKPVLHLACKVCPLITAYREYFALGFRGSRNTHTHCALTFDHLPYLASDLAPFLV